MILITLILSILFIKPIKKEENLKEEISYTLEKIEKEETEQLVESFMRSVFYLLEDESINSKYINNMISENLKEEVQKSIEKFNEKNLNLKDIYYEHKETIKYEDKIIVKMNIETKENLTEISFEIIEKEDKFIIDEISDKKI